MKKNLLLLVVALLLCISNVLSQEHALFFHADTYNSDLVTAPQIDEVLGDSARTVDCWILASSARLSNQVIIEWGDYAEEQARFTFRFQDDFLRVEHLGGNKIGATAVTDSVWHHVAVVCEKGAPITDLKFYIDGVEDTYSGQKGETLPFNTGEGIVTIGGSTRDLVFRKQWNGGIDELRVWNKALSATEINDVMNKVTCPSEYPDLVAYYRFNEGSGTTVKDETDNGYDGTLGGEDEVEDLIPERIDGAVTIESGNCDGTAVFQKTLDDTTISIYPNPASLKLTISGQIDVAKVEMYNLLGKKVYETPQSVTFPYQLDISTYEPGFYFVKVVTKEGNDYVKRLVKK